ncbi:GNAT family N-acetyltransferase [Nemorincola caseinilytica]|uniref:GNAT family N-acetyltransferase n=1 Tax=Nemorincola caseinilytica TaxID=2054315 RepID=A0ABP8NAJ6_9BACT
MRMHEVSTAGDKKAFLQVAVDIYANDPNWIRPLDKDIEEVFDAEKNKFIKRGGEYARWILQDDNGRNIGRIAAFVNKQYKQEQPTGGIGFFECDNNYEHAAFMFDHCKKWLQDRGMEAMDGPINFGERDKWWGLLTDGFYPPLYGMTYNPPYYVTLFEQYGFQTYFNQVCFALKVKNRLDNKFYERHAKYAADPEYTAQHIRKSDLDKYVKDFTYIYNKAWAGHGGGKSLEEKTVAKMFKAMKPVMDEKIIWFVYHKGQPIAMWVNLPDLNQFFKHLNGKFGLLQKVRFLLMQRFGKCNRFVGLVFGIIPEYQGKGIDGYMILEGANVIQPMGMYEDYEMQWIGDFNPKMVNIAAGLGTTRSRNLKTYRYLFDRNKEFKRHKIL